MNARIPGKHGEVGKVELIGEMGHGSAMHLTAIGDAVNTASRLESATKEFGAELVISEEVVKGKDVRPLYIYAENKKDDAPATA